MKSAKNTGVSLHTQLQPNWLGEYCRGRDGRPVRKHPIAPVNIGPLFYLTVSLFMEIVVQIGVLCCNTHFANFIFEISHPDCQMKLDLYKYGFPLVLEQEMATFEEQAPPYQFS